ncbi:hypothetical protein DSOL_3704 [Desulfosporosinus metallidurans]|uniref:Uncharacterized protein n=1 Tax=Desulfosporosinus metallidurans TaxID=1888891 RepID=A0A1Q8QNW6_9FIRM|nr:hypothetical protein DSOL_3704 [Desulfosporosinus metallidurans]
MILSYDKVIEREEGESIFRQQRVEANQESGHKMALLIGKYWVG